MVDKETEDRMIQWVEKSGVEVEKVEWELDLLGEEEFDEELTNWAWDDVKGEPLDLQKVVEARMEEVEYMIKKNVWKEVSVDECWNKTGKEPVTVKWVDTEKGSGADARVRSRLVARDFRKKGDNDREDSFAATPPLEALRLLISKAATKTAGGGRAVRGRQEGPHHPVV